MGEGRGVTYRMIREVERARVERRVVRTDERIASMISCKFERWLVGRRERASWLRRTRSLIE